MTKPTDNLLDWLRDAHAMEEQAEKMLTAQAERIEHYPQLRARIVQHIEETKGQQRLLVECIERLGGSTSTLKDMAGKLMAFAQGVGGMTMSDEVVKGAMSGYVFENLEIASYTVLIEAAEYAGDTLTADACRSIIKEEIAMSEWLRDHLPELTRAFLTRSATPGQEAKK